MADYLDFFQEHFVDEDSEFSDSDFEGFEEEDIVERVSCHVLNSTHMGQKQLFVHKDFIF